eukprot:TRINITY_DN46911_c0_g1_i1.p1 TRINITY_DN46911_c0_g1~~TRINITY_DN46911_c0_g1_i1.p1  ORF type:complete len:271 (+),score=50.95 TRINITY_DN46911_c0_g1_i1:24-836(+)
MKIKFNLKSRIWQSVPPSSPTCAIQCGHQFGKAVGILHKTCLACQSTIWPGQVHLKCSQCQHEVHTDCQDKVSNSQPKSLPDFIFPGGVAIPAVLVNCLAVIESHGLETQGLYRVPGNDLKIKALTAKVMKGDYIGHSLADLDVHILCGLVKEFFRSLECPLILFDMQNLASAMDIKKEILIQVSVLPTPNKETLAFFMLHLQKVTRSPATKMSAETLATVLAMCLFSNTNNQEDNLEEMLLDNKNKRTLVQEMLKMDPTEWKMMLAGKL